MSYGVIGQKENGRQWRLTELEWVNENENECFDDILYYTVAACRVLFYCTVAVYSVLFCP